AESLRALGRLEEAEQQELLLKLEQIIRKQKDVRRWERSVEPLPGGPSPVTEAALKLAKELTAWTEVDTILKAQDVAWNKGELEGFMAGYWKSDDLTFVAGDKKTRGWQATLDRYRKKYQGEGKEMGKLSFKDIDVRLIADDHALVTGRWQLEM